MPRRKIDPWLELGFGLGLVLGLGAISSGANVLEPKNKWQISNGKISALLGVREICSCLNFNEWIQWIVWIWLRRLYKKCSPKRKRVRITSKKSKMSEHFCYFFYFLWEVYKRLKFHFALIFFLKFAYFVLTARN